MYNSSEMDTITEIKQEDPLSDSVTSQSEVEFISNVANKTNIDGMFLDNDCVIPVKTEIKSEAPFPDSCSQKDTDVFTRHQEKEIISETVKCSNNSEQDTKNQIEDETLASDFDSHNEIKFLPQFPIVKIEEYHSDHEMNAVFIKEEPYYPETESSSVCDDIKDEEDFSSMESPGLCREADPHADDIIPVNSFTQGHSLFVHDFKTSSYQLYGNSFTGSLESLHEDKRPFECNVCKKSFTRLHNLKRHHLIHEGNKPHKCGICEKSFLTAAYLKGHNLIHEGIKAHKCIVCERSFTTAADLKRHTLIHEGKKPYKCSVCDKRFTRATNLKTHNLIHEGKKPHKCSVCEKTFTQSANLKTHNLIHEGRKPHKCSICDNSFTTATILKRHYQSHERKKQVTPQ